MKQWQVKVNNTTFDKVRITTDCQEAICEYIWNGFEAGATAVEVRQVGILLEEPTSIQVIDNGKGIAYESLDDTFGGFLSSVKNVARIKIKSQVNQGKGRFSYSSFSDRARWSTIYKKNNELKSYMLSMNSTEKRDFSTTDVLDASNIESTGTTVEFPISDSTVMSQLMYNSIQQKLLQEFSWFLYLNKARNFVLNYIGEIVDYSQYIDTELSIEKAVTIYDETFKINLIVWQKNIDNASKIFYLDGKGEIYASDNTGFNKNTVGFFHNVFIESDYINSITKLSIPNASIADVEHSSQGSVHDMSRAIFLKLNIEVQTMLAETLKRFLIPRAEQELFKMEERGTIPIFPSDEYSQLRKKDFESVTKELYCIEPKIFHRLKPEQEKSLLGFMNLLLSTEERENILTIVEHVVTLTDEQRKNFADILQRTKLQYILNAIGTINNRLAVIDQLKNIVFDLSKFANERDHLQKIIEQHFWLFGEQYHMLTSDKTLATSLAEFEEITNPQTTKKKKSAKAKKELSQRADIFLYTQRIREDRNSEMLIVELKAPSVKLSPEVYNQVVRYANAIRKEPRFNATNRSWKFYSICSIIEDDVKVNYENFKQHGKNGLVNILGNFEIYALSWDDVFQSFEERHSFLLEKLKIDYTQTSAELGFSEDMSPSRDLVNEVSTRITALKIE